MKKRIVGILLSLLGVVGIGYSQEAPRIAVSTFDTKGNVSKDDADIITEMFITNLVSQGVNVIDRANFDKIMSEMKFQTSDWSDSAKTSELGKVLNATAVIRGQIMQTPSNVIITVTLLDVKTAKILSSATETAKDLQYLYTKYYSNYSSRDYIMELCKTIKAKIPEPDPIIGTWRCIVYDKTELPTPYLKWDSSNKEYYGSLGSVSCNAPKGEMVLNFKADGTIVIHNFVYYESALDFLPDGKYSISHTKITEKGSGFWTFTNSYNSGAEKYYNLQLDTPTKKNMAFSLKCYFNRSDLDGTLSIPDVATYYKFKATLKSGYSKKERSSYVFEKTELVNTYGTVNFSSWIKINEYKEEEKSK
ncbi:MAG: hypothetical protein K2J14_06585 [Treponemataceae bacterium]|nr:hypothetical protein [Treponemataceae bacterium]